MGGRGASSASAVAMKPKQKGHLRGSEIPATPAATAAYLGVSEDTAKILYGDVKAFTGSSYSSIRKAQRGVLNDKQYVAMDQHLEDYIAAAPKWGGGTTYRGIGLDKKTAATLLSGWDKGAIIDINGNGTASWSTDRNVSKSFASKGGDARLVFSCKTQNRGTSIKHISHFSSENEVLVSMKSKYRVVTKPKTVGGYTYIEVEEV